MARTPLQRQIDATEQRLALCYRTSTLHTAALKARVRHKLSSPWALLFMAGAGIAIGYFRAERVAAPAPAPADESVPHDIWTPAVLLNIVTCAAPALVVLWQQMVTPPPVD